MNGESGNRQGARRATADSRSRELPQVHRRVAAGSAGVTAPPCGGVIGTGALGFHHARLLRRMRRVFAGIYDKNPVRAAEVAKQLETAAHPALAALLERVDAVTVAVPTPAHVDVGMACWSAYRPPHGEAARRHGRGARRWCAAPRRRARCSRWDTWSGSTGRYGGRPLPRRASVPADRPALPVPAARTDVAVILDLMIHDLDLVLELVRAPVTDVRATGVAILTPHVDIANARIEFANGPSRISRRAACRASAPASFGSSTDRLLLARPGSGERGLLPAEAGMARPWCDHARADR